MDKKIFAVLLLGILLVTPFASASFGSWVSKVFKTENTNQEIVSQNSIIGPGIPKPGKIEQDVKKRHRLRFNA